MRGNSVFLKYKHGDFGVAGVITDGTGSEVYNARTDPPIFLVLNATLATSHRDLQRLCATRLMFFHQDKLFEVNTTELRNTSKRHRYTDRVDEFNIGHPNTATWARELFPDCRANHLTGTGMIPMTK